MERGIIKDFRTVKSRMYRIIRTEIIRFRKKREVRDKCI